MNVLRTTIEIAHGPARLIIRPFHHLFERRYRARRFAKIWFVIDIGLLLIAISLIGWILSKTIFAPPTIEEQVRVGAVIAPSQVVSGASATLVFRYENTSKENLKHAQLELVFPAHFSLQAIESGQTEIGSQTYDLGEIAAGTSGSLKIRGIIFGDVGGEQIFTTTLRFVHGNENLPVTKTDSHVFRPVRSTLSLELILPERVVEGQIIAGQIKYKNTGEIDFPEIVIEPTWPDDFILLTSSPSMTDGKFRLRALQAGEEGTINFTGRLPVEPTVRFFFAPKFAFGDTFYTQETLEQNVQLLPSQLSVTASFQDAYLTPGTAAPLDIHVENVGKEKISDVRVIIKTTNPFFQQQLLELNIGELAPGDASDGLAEFQLTRAVPADALSNFENLTAAVDVFVNYTLPDEIALPVFLFVESLTSKLTTPFILQNAARYFMPDGDQIGRGPLPPTVGETTKYWVFLTIDGTTNSISDVKLEAELGRGVVFTGRQSVSHGEGLIYDASANTIRWTIDSLAPTLDPKTLAVNVAFEIALTPTEEMIGTAPTLLFAPFVTGRDDWTGAFVTARGSNFTTDLQNDAMAANLGNVTK